MKCNCKVKSITTFLVLVMFLFSIAVANRDIEVSAATGGLSAATPTINGKIVTIKLTNNVEKNDTVTIRIYDKKNNSIKYLNQGNLSNGEIIFTAELEAGTYYGVIRSASDASTVTIGDFTVGSSGTGSDGDNNGVGGTGNTGGNTGGLSEVVTSNASTDAVVGAINSAASNGKIIVDVTENKIVAKDIFDTIKGTDKTITFKQGAVEWTFNGKDITSTTKAIDMTVAIAPLGATKTKNKEGIAEKVKNENVLVISFANNGQLPGKASVRIKLDPQWLTGKNKNKMSIYYYNEATKAIEVVASGLKIDAEGYVVFEITHNSDYIVSDIDLSAIPEEQKPQAPEIVRLGGANRYETSVKVSQVGWTNSDNVVLARGDEYADALAAAPLAKQLNAPILLTATKALDSSVITELKRLKVKKVYIVGGIGAISAAVENTVKVMGIRVERISGSDRYATSLEIANRITNKKQVFLVTGTSFADALSISSYAAATGSPILLTGKNQMSDGVAKFIKDNNSKVYVIGGSGIITDSIVKSIAGAQRIAGADRYATNLAVLNKFANGFDFSNIYLATGTNYPDAICGSALAGKEKAPIILVNNNSIASQKAYIKTIIEKGSKIKVLGGEGVLTSDIIRKLISN